MAAIIRNDLLHHRLKADKNLTVHGIINGVKK